MSEYILTCTVCGLRHSIEVDVNSLSHAQKSGIAPVLDNFVCPSAARMYRVTSYAFDLRVNSLNLPATDSLSIGIVAGLAKEWGENDIDQKVRRYKELGLAFLGIPEEYYKLQWEVVSSYCCGQYFPSMTSAGSLAERILNRLILKIGRAHV